MRLTELAYINTELAYITTGIMRWKLVGAGAFCEQVSIMTSEVLARPQLAMEYIRRPRPYEREISDEPLSWGSSNLLLVPHAPTCSKLGNIRLILATCKGGIVADEAKTSSSHSFASLQFVLPLAASRCGFRSQIVPAHV